MLNSIYDLPEADFEAFQEKESLIRDNHRLNLLLGECDECFERHEIKGEPRPADGYICPLNNLAYCSCQPESEAHECFGIDAEDWDCPDYLKEAGELKASFGVEP